MENENINNTPDENEPETIEIEVTAETADDAASGSEKFIDDLANFAANAYEVTDEIVRSAVRVIVGTGKASVSLLQRNMRVGYAQATRIMERLSQLGIVGKLQNGAYALFANLHRPDANGETRLDDDTEVAEEPAPESEGNNGYAKPAPKYAAHAAKSAVDIKEFTMMNIAMYKSPDGAVNEAAKLAGDLTAYYAQIYIALGANPQSAYAMAGWLLNRIGAVEAIKSKSDPQNALNVALSNYVFAKDMALSMKTQESRIASGQFPVANNSGDND